MQRLIIYIIFFIIAFDSKFLVKSLKNVQQSRINVSDFRDLLTTYVVNKILLWFTAEDQTLQQLQM